MASFGSRNVQATAIVKGGMPVNVTGVYVWDETGSDIERTEVRWHSTGKPVTAKFLDSLTDSDWESISEALLTE